MATTISTDREEQDEQGSGSGGKYKPEFNAQARKLCRLGAIDEELADFFGVSRRTIDRWKSKYPLFGKAIKVGKDRADDRVEMALYRRAVGFVHRETKVMQYQGTPVFAEVDVYVIPDVKAATTWLVNRRGWRMNPTGPVFEDVPTPKSIPVEIIDGRLPAPENGDAD